MLQHNGIYKKNQEFLNERAATYLDLKIHIVFVRIDIICIFVS